MRRSSMSHAGKPRGAGRPLIRARSVVALVSATALALYALLPLVRDRQRRAGLLPPDLLSLAYLKLGVDEQPADAALRFSLCERSLEAGLFDAAREALAPLLSSDDVASARARDLLVELEFRAWAATLPSDLEARGAALGRLDRALAAIELAASSVARVEHLAELCKQAELHRRRAELLGHLALREPTSDAHVALADAAYMATAEPMKAALLHALVAERSPSRAGPEHARLALERAKGANQPREALQLFQRLHARFGGDTELLQIGLSLAAGLDDRLSLALAERLLVARPGDAQLRRRIAELADYTGHTERAIEQYVWLGTHSGGPPDLERARARAQAKSALRLTLALSPGSPRSKSELFERIGLHEALGDVAGAIGTLDAALATRFSEDISLWQLKLELHRRAGNPEEALQTLDAMQARFPEARELYYQRANLLLSLGRLAEALDVLGATPSSDAVHIRKVSLLAWELGDTERARRAYDALIATPDASEWDFQRSWLLAQEAQDYRGGVETALDAWQRFGSPGLLGLAIYSAMAWDKPELLSQLLATAESAGPHFSANPAYWQLRIQLEQQRADQALAAARHSDARLALAASAELLRHAEAAAPDAGGRYEPLWRAREKGEFAVALASNDTATLARVYPTEAPHLAPRERVHVLYRLGQNEDAAELALREARRGAVSVEDRAGLLDDARTLTLDMPRKLAVNTGVTQFEGLRSLSLGARTEYNRRSDGWSASVELAELTGAAFGLEPARELTAELSGHNSLGALTLGVVARNEGKPRPLVRFGRELWRNEGGRLSIAAKVNDRSQDSAALRVLAVEDEVALDGRVGVGDDFFLAGGASAKAYSTRDREYLGAALDIDAALGRSFRMPDDLGAFAMRVASYVVPRFSRDERPFVPESAVWVGLGTSLSRGQLGAVVIDGRGFTYALDVATGYLVLQDAFGWWTSAGVGLPVLGSDLISVSMRAGNVLGAAPDSAMFGLSASYAISQW